MLLRGAATEGSSVMTTVHEEHEEELDLILKFTCSFEYIPFPCFFNGCVRLFVAMVLLW